MMNLRQLPMPLRMGLPFLAALLLVLIACAGIIYCALQGSLLGVLLSSIVPGLAGAWFLWSPGRP